LSEQLITQDKERCTRPNAHFDAIHPTRSQQTDVRWRKPRTGGNEDLIGLRLFACGSQILTRDNFARNASFGIAIGAFAADYAGRSRRWDRTRGDLHALAGQQRWARSSSGKHLTDDGPGAAAADGPPVHR
jgi:hypothetical protein